MEQCPGHPNTPELCKQLNRLQDYCFPGEQNLAIGRMRHLTQAEWEKLQAFQRDQSATAKANLQEQAQQLRRSLAPSQILAEFGILSAEQMERWREAARGRDKDDVNEVDDTDSEPEP